MSLCECCREKEGHDCKTRVAEPAKMSDILVGLPIRSRFLLAVLCHKCAKSGHALDTCHLCTMAGTVSRVWFCARVRHVSEFHRSYIDKGANMPEPVAPGPKQKYLGKLIIPEDAQ